MLDALIQDLRYAIRALRSSPGFAAVAILSLALGIGANTAIFSLIDSVMLKSLPVSHPEQLVQVWNAENFGYYTNPQWEAIRDRQQIFSGLAAFASASFNLASGGEARPVQGYLTGGQFFDTLGVHPYIGRLYNPSDDRRGCAPTAVLSYSFWQKEYSGRSDILGHSISLDAHPFQILGVSEAGFTGIDVGRNHEIFVPLCTEPILRGENTALDRRTSWWMQIVARPKLGISETQASAALLVMSQGVMDATVPPNYRAENRQKFLGTKLTARPVSNGLSRIRSDYQQALITLIVVAGVVLLIACANVANLLLARGAARQKEIAIRMALGSGRGRLIRQLLTESLFLSISGAVLGILFARWGGPLLVRFISTAKFPVDLDLSIDARMLGFTISIAIVTALLFGLAPAWRGTRVDPQSAMKSNARGVIEGGKFGLGKALVTLQVALSLLLTIGAGLMVSTFFKLLTLNMGFDRDRVLIVQADIRHSNFPQDRRNAFFEQVVETLRAIPGVSAASESDNTPISGGIWSGPVAVQGKSASNASVAFNEITPQFFKTMGTPLLAGRDFDARDTLTSPKVAIINQTMARKYFGDENPLGKIMTAIDSKVASCEIIGVVADAKYWEVREDMRSTAYITQAQDEKPHMYPSFELRVAQGSPSALIPAVTDAITQINRGVSLRFTTLATQVDESLNRERLLAALSGFFSALALALATIGLYGVMSYNVARRRNEIGIRMALGAEQSRVLRMVLGEVAMLIGIGVVAGLAAASAATRFVATFLYGLKPNDPGTLVAAIAVLTIVAAIAGYFPARRASRLDPMSALRDE